MRKLVLIRHGQSEWNAQNLFTGWRNSDLSIQGKEEAKKAGLALKAAGLIFDRAFTSSLLRAQNTCKIILETMKQKPPLLTTDALNERDYGLLSGMNKDEAAKKWGKEQIHTWRRSYDIAPPQGESLRDTCARVWLYYIPNIQPHLLRGESILITAHGNSLRALIMLLEGLSPQEIVQREVATGRPVVYEFNADSTLQKKHYY